MESKRSVLGSGVAIGGLPGEPEPEVPGPEGDPCPDGDPEPLVPPGVSVEPVPEEDPGPEDGPELLE